MLKCSAVEPLCVQGVQFCSSEDSQVVVFWIMMLGWFVVGSISEEHAVSIF
jgi:hypothetical protein